MGEIEEGEYVKTDEGYIAKYLGRDDWGRHAFDDDIYDRGDGLYVNFIYNSDWDDFTRHIEKHDEKLIKLVEYGDYVNGEEVIWINGKNDMVSIESNPFIEEEDIESVISMERLKADSYYRREK